MGLSLTVRVWSVVLAVWLVPLLLFAPASLMVDRSIGVAMGELPEAGAVAGDPLLVLAETLPPLLPHLLVALATAAILLWQWGVVWRAGVVAWQLGVGGGPASVARVVGLGLTWWWPYLRLSLCGLGALAAAGLAVWLPLGHALWSAYNEMAEERLLPVVAAGLLLTLVAWVLVWSASLHAAWLLGRPDRRSALLAWWAGLVATLKSPLAPIATLALWALPALLLSPLPLVLGVVVGGLRGGVAGALLLHLCALAVAFCRVALFASFAPVSGLVGDRDAGAPHAGTSSPERGA